MKYSESRDFQDKAFKMFGDDIDGFLKAKRELQEKEKKIADAIEVLKSCYDSETVSNVFAYALISEHRTNQQSAIKNLFKALKIYSETGTDDRNSQAVKWAKSATDQETYFPYI